MPLKLYKRKGVWYYDGTVNQRRLRNSTRTADKKLAARIASKAENDAWKGYIDGPESILTFAQAALKYRAADKQVRFLAPIEDYWKDTLVKDITEGGIIQSSLEILPNVTGATRNRNVIVPTRAIINHCAKLKLCKSISVDHFPSVHKVRHPVTLEWVEAFMAVSEPHLGALALFMFLTGARISEALRLHWEDVDFNRKVALVRETKEGNPGEAHLPQKLIVALSNIKRVPNRPVFFYWTDSQAKEPWRRAVKKAGIQPLSFHCCRHGFATALLRAGVDVVTIAKLGRWRSAQHVLRTYGHANEDKTLTDLIAGTILVHGEIPQRKNKLKTGT